MSSKRKLALLIPRLAHGGAERVVTRMAEVLKDDFQITIIVFNDKEISYDCECRIISLNTDVGYFSILKRIYNTVLRIIRFRRIIKNNNIDICFSFGDSANIVNILSFLRTKKIISLRGYAKIIQPNSLLKKYLCIPVMRTLYSQVEEIICVSEKMKNDLIINYKTDPHNVYTLYNGYNCDEIIKMSKAKCPEDIRKKVANKTVIISIGTYRYPKGYWHLVRSFAEINKINPNTHLIIIGYNHDNNKKRILDLVNKLEIEESVDLLDFDPNPFKYIAISNVYVLPSITEGFPNALVEAMTCGIAVIASDCKTGPREILTSQYCDIVAKKVELADYGILVPPMTGKEIYDKRPLLECEVFLKEAMQILVDDKKLQQEYACKAFDRAKQYSYTEWKKELKEIIRIE